MAEVNMPIEANSSGKPEGDAPITNPKRDRKSVV